MNRKIFLIWLGLIVAYFLSRLHGIGNIPIFTDEAIYIRWAQIMSGDLNYLYLPLTDGKPPLFMWLAALVLKTSIDPLVCARLVSIFAGFMGLLGIYFTSRQLFKEKLIAYLSIVFYILCPFTYFYDRFALADSLLAAIAVWTLGIGVNLAKNPKLLTALLLGLVGGIGLWTKSPALEFIALLPTLFILGKRKYLVYLFPVGVISWGIYKLLFFLPQAYIINLKNYEFIIPLSEFIKNPLRLVPGNITALTNWELTYLTIPILLLVILSLLKISKPKIILIGYFMAHFVFMCLFNKVIYPRFLLMFTPMLLILAASGLTFLKSNSLKTLILLIIIINVIATRPIADTDFEQYLNSWSAGWGVKQLNIQLSNISSNKKIVLGTEGTFGLMPYALEIYQKNNSNLKIKSYWPPLTDLPNDLDYYVVYQREIIPQGWRVRLVGKWQQGSSASFLKLYQVLK